MVGQGKRMESGGVLREQDESGGACQPYTLPQCGVRAYRSNSSSGGNRGPGVKKFVRIWETRERPSSPPPWERSSTEDPGSGPRQVTVTRPLGRPTPWNAVNSTHARRSQASEWTHSRSGGARRLRWSLGCLTLQGPARPPRWVRASFPSVLKRRGSLGGSRPPPRPLPLSSKVRGPSRLAAQPQHVPDIPHSSPTFPSVPCRWAEAT
ncbi:uncharacterized protein LOC106559595 isoform X3 [Canis lupus familiaris]|uniref:uncharacterized protein LOC106559595 isoform X3 n=1 Tax=Canis lupus familiaris TaxID=9615 RepID=UPI0006B3DA48|nr:uncharacterized protein LOC106559595 isoform X3 [Canis lupus familiaris]|eukprot:XP_013973748.1 uncharacterized protein LOC106559595 isoform X1 [Canis lupus familiaris]